MTTTEGRVVGVTEQDRLKMSVGMGYKEREAVLPTPDYLPSFMEVWNPHTHHERRERRLARPCRRSSDGPLPVSVSVCVCVPTLIRT